MADRRLARTAGPEPSAAGELSRAHRADALHDGVERLRRARALHSLRRAAGGIAGRAGAPNEITTTARSGGGMPEEGCEGVGVGDAVGARGDPVGPAR